MTADTPLIVVVAPTGARKTRADHPELPVSPDEIARTAAACREAGAAMIHLHVRDRDGRHTLDVDAYRAAIAAVRGAVGDGLIIQATSESVGLYGPGEQMAMVRELRPEAISLAVRELCPDTGSEREAAAFFAWLAAERIAPQFILYSAEDVERFADLRRRGVVPGDQAFVLYVLGRYSVGRVSSPADLLPFLDAPGGLDAIWSICAFGRRECACALTAAAFGGHVRVGFENNLYMADGAVARDNAALVEQIAGAARLVGRHTADAATARTLLGMK